MSGTLYLVSTPIGNLEDITLRALRILKEVDLVAAEDTRHTIKLLNHYEISTNLTSYFEHNKTVKGKYLKDLLLEGKNIALVTDAGTPGISDPGEMIVKDCISAGIKVVPVPGPTALIASLSISGLSTDSFLFRGFLPKKTKGIKEVLEGLKEESATLIFYESPHRVKETLKIMAEIFGKRQAVIVRELTKFYEEIKRGSLDELAEIPFVQKGEFCIMVAGRDKSLDQKKVLTDDELKIAVLDLQKEKGLSLKEAVREIAHMNGLSTRDVYQLMIKSSFHPPIL
ncbi:MAG: 16S rRNA (cytidine(1402)-2'-O)-methyltransferase [bacterium]|nr:16S rRNA (cytidine(1402)-2'-O)-methyltransferase [bacterium]